MGRPSKKAERTEEIINAFYRCVARYGIEGSTLEHIAEESGLKRSLVRHFVGNREELTALLVDKVLLQSNTQWREFLQSLPETNTAEALLDGLFDDQNSDPEYVLVLESLIFSAGRDAVLRERMQKWLRRFTDDISGLLNKQFPDANPETLAAVSYGIISLYFNLDSLAPLDMNQLYRQPARHAAELLLDSIRTQQ